MLSESDLWKIRAEIREVYESRDTAEWTKALDKIRVVIKDAENAK